jgi:hypothetical protein
VPASTPSFTENNNIEDDGENEDDVPDDISDVSSDASSVEYKPSLVIGENIDSNSDSFIPPPPPLEDASSESIQYQLGTPDVSPETPPFPSSTIPVPSPDSNLQPIPLEQGKSDESEKYSPLD